MLGPQNHHYLAHIQKMVSVFLNNIHLYYHLHVTSIKLKTFQVSSVSHADYENEASLDFQGNLADKSKTGGWLAAGLILGMYT